MPSSESKPKEALEYGRLHESDAASEFQRTCLGGYESALKETGIWPLYYDSFSLGVSPDRLVVDPETGDVIATYEAKCPVSGKLANPPHPEYLLQVHAAGVEEGYLHVWTPEKSSYYRVTTCYGRP